MDKHEEYYLTWLLAFWGQDYPKKPILKNINMYNRLMKNLTFRSKNHIDFSRKSTNTP